MDSSSLCLLKSAYGIIAIFGDDVNSHLFLRGMILRLPRKTFRHPDLERAYRGHETEVHGMGAIAPLDAVEAAKILHMNSRTLVRWARCGYVPAHPLGEGKRRIWRFFESELLEWVERQQNGCVRGPEQSTIPIAIGAHAKKEIA